MANTTTLVLANKSDSLRTTVPASIVKLLELRQGDHVEWDVRPDGNRFAVKIEFVKPKDARTKGRANQNRSWRGGSHGRGDSDRHLTVGRGLRS